MSTKERIYAVIAQRYGVVGDIECTAEVYHLIDVCENKEEQPDLLRAYYIGIHYFIGLKPWQVSEEFEEQYSLEDYDHFCDAFGAKIAGFFCSFTNPNLTVNEFYERIWAYIQSNFKNERNRILCMFYIAMNQADMLLDTNLNDFIDNHVENTAFHQELDDYLNHLPYRREIVDEILSVIGFHKMPTLYKYLLYQCKELLTEEERNRLIKEYEKAKSDPDSSSISDEPKSEDKPIFFWRNDHSKPVHSLRELIHYGRSFGDFDYDLWQYMDTMMPDNSRKTADELLDIFRDDDMEFYPDLYIKFLNIVDRRLISDEEYTLVEKKFIKLWEDFDPDDDF